MRALEQRTPTVVIGEPHAGFEFETAQIGATYVSRLEVELFEKIVRSALDDESGVRRSARTPVSQVVALVNGATAQVKDVSYDGLSFEVGPGSAAPFGRSVLIHLPMFNLRCEAQPVWTSPTDEGHSTFSCGVVLTGNDPQANVEWRAVVDSLVSGQPHVN
jgi:hypothetical protein